MNFEDIKCVVIFVMRSKLTLKYIHPVTANSIWLPHLCYCYYL